MEDSSRQAEVHQKEGDKTGGKRKRLVFVSIAVVVVVVSALVVAYAPICSARIEITLVFPHPDERITYHLLVDDIWQTVGDYEPGDGEHHLTVIRNFPILNSGREGVALQVISYGPHGGSWDVEIVYLSSGMIAPITIEVYG